jgi:WD40 repeat protein
LFPVAGRVVMVTDDGLLVNSAGPNWPAWRGRVSGVTGHTDGVTSVMLSPDGTRIVSSSYDHTLRLWPAVASPTDLCNKLTANMSHQQWHDWVSPDIGYIPACPGLPVPADTPK